MASQTPPQHMMDTQLGISGNTCTRYHNSILGLHHSILCCAPQIHSSNTTMISQVLSHIQQCMSRVVYYQQPKEYIIYIVVDTIGVSIAYPNTTLGYQQHNTHIPVCVGGNHSSDKQASIQAYPMVVLYVPCNTQDTPLVYQWYHLFIRGVGKTRRSPQVSTSL